MEIAETVFPVPVGPVNNTLSWFSIDSLIK